MDTLAVNTETQIDLLSAVESILDREGVKSMAMFVPRDWVLLRAAAARGLSPVSKGTYFMTYPEATHPAGLYVQMADNDIF